MCGETSEVDSLHAALALFLLLVKVLMGKMCQAGMPENKVLLSLFLFKNGIQVFRWNLLTSCVRGIHPVGELVMSHASFSVLWYQVNQPGSGI